MIVRRRTCLAAALFVATLLATGCDDATVPAENPFQCIGLPTATCERFLAEARRSVPNSAPISAVIKCTAVCTEEQGDATLLVVFANGERVEYGTGWAQAQGGGVDPEQPAPGQPAPVPPVPVEAPEATASPAS